MLYRELYRECLGDIFLFLGKILDNWSNYDGVHDERFSLDGQIRKIGLRREEGCPLMDSRVNDGFSVKFYGNTSLNFNQAYFSNWISGGESSLTVLYRLNYNFNYSDRTGLVWDTNILFSLGTTYISGNKFLKKADDRIEISSLLGKQINPTRKPNKSYSKVLLNKTSDQLIQTTEQSVSNALSYRITAAYHSFFATSAVSQPAHQTNPIDAMTHARRSTSLGPGGLTREHAGIAVRGIHPSHFGRLCPVETPEGQNTGLVNSPSYCTRVNLYGFFETPYWPIKQQQVIKKKGAIYLSPNQENQVWVIPNEVLVSKNGYLPKSALLSRSGQDFAYLPSKDINYFGVLPNQVFSLGASLIPFMEHDDGNRALMGSNMQRQAVPILKNERPFVGTGLESVVVSDTRAGVRALASGYVYYVSGKKILIHSLIHWRKPAGLFETIEYQLGRYETTNQGTCVDQKPIVFEGDWIQTLSLIHI